MNANKIILNDEVLIDLTQDTATEEDVAKGKTFHKADGSVGVGTGGGAELNIAYGDIPPEDTSKLWVKTSEPSGVIVSPNIEYEEVSDSDATITELETTFPDVLSYFAYASVGNKIYSFGGVGSSGATNKIYCFDAESNESKTLSTTLPNAKASVCGTAVGTNIYVFGDERYIYCFDTNTEVISTLATRLPSTTSAPRCAAVGTKIYIFSGNSTAIYCFDTATLTITTLSTTLAESALHRGIAVIGTKIYLLGGWISSVPTANTYVFDTETLTLTTLSTPLPLAMSNMMCVSVDNTIYIFGGQYLEETTKQINKIWCFDVVTGTIDEMPLTLPYNFCGGGVAQIDRKIYILCGYGGANYSTRFDDINVFQYALFMAKVAENVLQIVTQKESNIFSIINTEAVKVEVGIETVYKGNAEGYGEQVVKAVYKDGVWTII